jgi:hypothetical protein
MIQKQNCIMMQKKETAVCRENPGRPGQVPEGYCPEPSPNNIDDGETEFVPKTGY